jgi:multicomponent Na+:H+ antiporter subunit G
MIVSILTVLFLLSGTAFMVIATVGLIRLPDLYTRMHAITKAGTLGIILVTVSLAVHFADLSVATRAVALVVFVLLTAPVSAHMIGRAGYLGEVALWSGTLFDQWDVSFGELRRETVETEANARRRASPATGGDGRTEPVEEAPTDPPAGG